MPEYIPDQPDPEPEELWRIISIELIQGKFHITAVGYNDKGNSIGTVSAEATTLSRISEIVAPLNLVNG